MYIPLTFEGALQKCLFASGGIEGNFISGSQQWAYHYFTSSAKLNVLKGTIDNAQIIVVGGGGGGAYAQAAAGGGAGGVNYNANVRLFAGEYSITVGAGGRGGQYVNPGDDNPGDPGISSEFAGPGVSLVASGGGAGNYGNGNRGGSSGAPTSFSGGLNLTDDGGGGAGASAVGANATSTNGGNGGAGLTYYFIGTAKNFGCGGGGSSNANNAAGVSGCNSPYGRGGDTSVRATSGLNYTGGGGGGSFKGYSTFGGDGGSGSVIIQYPVNNYCKNYFNQTGSCNCGQVLFDVTDSIDFKPEYSGTFYYTPCGSTELVSGSVFSYFPVTECASSGTWYGITTNNPAGGAVGFIGDGPGAKCISQSAFGGEAPCTTQQFFPTTSSVVTYKNTAGSSGGQLYWLPSGSNTISKINLISNQKYYVCAQTGAAWIPYGLTGAGSAITSSTIDICSTPVANCDSCSWYYISGSSRNVFIYNECGSSNWIQASGTNGYVAVNTSVSSLADGYTATNLSASTITSNCPTCSFSSSYSYTTSSLSLWHRCETYFTQSVSGSSTWYDSSRNNNQGTIVTTAASSSALPTTNGLLFRKNATNYLKWINTNQTLNATPSSSYSFEIMGGPFVSGSSYLFNKGNLSLPTNRYWNWELKTDIKAVRYFSRPHLVGPVSIDLPYTSSIDLTTGSNHLISLTLDATAQSASLYINGQFQSSKGYVEIVNYDFSTGSLQAFFNDASFSANPIKHFSLYSKILNSTEIQTNYNYLSSLTNCACNTGSI